MKKIILFMLTSVVVLLMGCNKDQSTYEKIQKSKEMSFAMTGAYPPFNFINEEGELDGFDIDIANALAEQMGVKAVPITTAWDGIIGGLESSRFDTIIGSMAITEERLERVSFTQPYYYDGAQFFTVSSSELTSIEELENGKVGVVTGTTFHDALLQMENITQILQFESDVDNFMTVEQGRSDGLVTAKFVGLQAPEKYGVDIKPVGPMLYAENIGIAVRKDDEELLNALNESLDKIIENGTYSQISDKWFGVNILEK
ncbi:ABC transporter substrate-binding protein [Cellulosilyticum sp. I15G10I2]|uniref:ABC transporter substrate-binding protein n=1 Tax=Cellulosilyticum sp. I15G10I2 TaxID=1892843 RepID=UPI00085BFB4B|nr:ABC transporter substrate-binding protein [Cellulosilyticum sp. I15G10I2]